MFEICKMSTISCILRSQWLLTTTKAKTVKTKVMNKISYKDHSTTHTYGVRHRHGYSMHNQADLK